jgi:predicted GTPase
MSGAQWPNMGKAAGDARASIKKEMTIELAQHTALDTAGKTLRIERRFVSQLFDTRRLHLASFP